MDSSSPHSHNWLAFSLSNHFPPSTTDSTSPLSLFHSFTSPTSPPTTVAGTGPQIPDQPAPTNLSIFTGAAGPKFEDFLGCSTAATSGTTTTALPPPPISQFSTDTAHAVTNTEFYDSELKTIAASFLHGFASAEHTEANKQSLVSTEPSPKKAVDTFGQRTSIYRGVTRHRWTGRYEAHLWDNSCRREGQSRKGRQGNLGGYDKEDKAARAYDLAALKYWGPTTTTNFPISNYEKELEEMKNMTRQEFVASLRRKSSGFSRGASMYRGVTRHHQHGRWQARIGRVAGNKDLYLGTFSTQEEAAEAYDIAAIKFRGLNAVTNFDMSRYDVKSIANGNLPIGGLSNKSKNSSESVSESKSQEVSRSDDRDLSSASSVTFAASQPTSSTLSFAIPIKQDPSDYWPILGYQNPSLDIYTKNSVSTIAPTLFQSCTTSGSVIMQGSNSTPFNMDFSGSESNNGFLNGGIYVQQQSSSSIGTSSSIPFATPTSLNSNNSYESNSSGYGSWNRPSRHHTIQTHVKPSLLQTPIFGME
ncbi:AP2-like ethylene-responsive transcription factor [Quillaja saponaria]|uniref:AP2-like ethylene-responsive transcription factor n=1 Tax=Quillaja saponaria TaxID=32244 RepID=A0AAD7LCV8_QUISA|nr:AP2-like ethylene-responsive transcription factor [Quillaja saponaria]